MRLDEMVPYERNGRDHSKNVAALMESIRRFGFRGTILLESRERPVIVCGHGRVEACKRLGWDELADEHIVFADGMTPDEVRAYRIADNQIGRMATYKPSVLRAELKGIKTVDMAALGCAAKSKGLPYGAERLRTDDAYNLRLVNAFDCDEAGMPVVEPVDAKPARMVGFNFAKSMAEADKTGACCHFFVDDYQFERVWTNPERWVDVLRGFDCVLSPDFSMYMDMPLPMQRWNEYRRRAVMLVWQRAGLSVVPTLSWADVRSFDFCLAGLPEGGTVAVSTVGVKSDPAAQAVWGAGMAEAMQRLGPSRVLLYGGDIGFDFGDAEVVEYRNEQVFRKGGK